MIVNFYTFKVNGSADDAGSGCQMSISVTLPWLSWSLYSKVHGIIPVQFKVDASLYVTGNLKAKRELICASQSKQRHAAFISVPIYYDDLLWCSSFCLWVITKKVTRKKLRVRSLWHFVLPSDLFPSLLLLRRSQSFTPFSLMALLKHSPRTAPPPPRWKAIIKLQLSNSTVVFFGERRLTWTRENHTLTAFYTHTASEVSGI